MEIGRLEMGARTTTFLVRVLFPAIPWLIVAAWFLAGQWRLARAEAHAWLFFIGPICLASLVPMPARRPRVVERRTALRWWGWIAVAGLLVTA